MTNPGLPLDGSHETRTQISTRTAAASATATNAGIETNSSLLRTRKRPLERSREQFFDGAPGVVSERPRACAGEVRMRDGRPLARADRVPRLAGPLRPAEIGRASCRER